MPISDHVDLEQFMQGVRRRNSGQVEFHQAVQEVAEDVFGFIAERRSTTSIRSCGVWPSPIAW